MGSFNTACFVTRQVITPGDEVVIMPITQSAPSKMATIVDPNNGQSMQVRPAFGSSCYSTGFWGYYGLFLKGKYADYGRFEISKEPENVRRLKWLLMSLKTDMFHTIQGDNKYHDLAALPPLVDVDSTDDEVIAEWDTLYESVFENRVFVRTFSGTPTQFSVAVMMKFTYDELIKMMRRGGVCDGYEFTVDEFIRKSINSDRRMMQIYYESFKKNTDDDALEALLRTIRTAPSRCLGGMGATHLRNFDESMLEGNQREIVLREIEEFLASSDEQKIPPFITGMLSWQVENLIAHMALSLMEVRIEPTYYAGQDYDNTCGKKFKNLLSAVTIAKTHALKVMMNDGL